MYPPCLTHTSGWACAGASACRCVQRVRAANTVALMARCVSSPLILMADTRCLVKLGSHAPHATTGCGTGLSTHIQCARAHWPRRSNMSRLGTG
eukprot:9994888-Karenia_brevis.AAC.1